MKNKEPGKWSRLFREKGDTMLLWLCAVAVGVSGVLFLGGALKERDAVQETLSVPVKIEQTEKTPTGGKAAVAEKPQRPETKPAVPDAAATTTAEAAETVIPVNGSVQQDYAMDHLSYQPTTRDWRVHNGVDLAAALGSQVKAARAGTVSAVYDDENYGATVVVQHDGGYTSHYCNLAAQPQVAVGDRVQAGDVLGEIGGTALLEAAQEPHLHFEVYCNGEPANPAGFLY